MRTDITLDIAPAFPAHETCRHHHAPVEIDLRRWEEPPTGDVVIAEIDGAWVAGLVTQLAVSTKTTYMNGPAIGSMPTRRWVKDRTRTLHEVEMLLIRPTDAGAVEFEPVRFEHRHGAWWALEPHLVATTGLDTAGLPTRSDRITWHASTEPVNGRLVCQSVLMRQDPVEHRYGSYEQITPDNLCQVCAEELTQVAHHAMHRYTVPLGSSTFFLETDEGLLEPEDEHPLGLDEMTDHTEQDRMEILTGLLYRAVEKGYIREEPRIGVTDAPTPEAVLEVRCESGRRVMNYHIPHQRALRWWKALLGLR